MLQKRLGITGLGRNVLSVIIPEQVVSIAL